jgi:putative oxidoreductase
MDIALLLVRLIGFGLAAHGAQKLFGSFGGYGLAGTGGFFEQLGFRPGKLFASAAGLAEFVGGLLLVLGLGGPIGPMLIVATMVVAILSVHVEHGFFASNNGYELPLTNIALVLLLAFTGYGRYGLDAAFGWAAFWTPAYVWIAIALGVLGGLANMAVRGAPVTTKAA